MVWAIGLCNSMDPELSRLREFSHSRLQKDQRQDILAQSQPRAVTITTMNIYTETLKRTAKMIRELPKLR